MKRYSFLLTERLGYLLIVTGLQWNVLREGVAFAKRVRRVVALPGLRDEGHFLGANDLSDHQWRSFRESAALLAAALSAYVAISHAARLLPAAMRQMVMVAVAVAFLGALHGACAVYVLGLALGAYHLSYYLAGKPYGLLGVWLYACSSLLLARLTDGLPFATISSSLAPLDRHRGLLRWHIHYNLVVLRIISFAADLHLARSEKRSAATARASGPPPTVIVGSNAASGGGSGGNGTGGGVSGGDGGFRDEGCEGRRGVAVETEDSSSSGGGGGSASGGALDWGSSSVSGGGAARNLDSELRVRVETSLPLPFYSVLPFLEYVLYPPLYIAGPIITFNSFASQRMLRRVPQLRSTTVLVYLARAALAWVCLEAVTHLLPYNSIAKHRVLDWLAAHGGAGAAGGGAWPTPRPLHYAITGYWVLVFMWLKFTVIWRFFRAAALADGVVPPENMTRCVCNNYDVEGFWRSWHASYNRWLVRYMYVPLGGSSWRAVNVWPIFTFVAVWHDLEWRLLGWAWIMAAAVAPEMAAKALGRSAAAQRWRGSWLFRQACALAAAFNILLLMAGNLVGFVVGVEGIGPLARQVLGQPRFLAVVLLALFSAAQLMFWKREVEARRPPTRT